MFNFIKSNKIGKDAVIEDGFLCSEYLEMKENSYVGQSTIVSSQTIEGKYGALTIRKVKIGENSVVGPFSVIAPGVELEDNTFALPFSGCTKNFKLKQDRFCWGRPATLIRRKKFEEYIQLPQKLRKKKEKLKEKISEENNLHQKEE